MTSTKWALLALIALGFLIFKYKTNVDQQATPSQANHEPVAAADSLPTASNAFVNYTTGLQNDVALARKNVNKYEASTKTESKAAGEGDGAP